MNSEIIKVVAGGGKITESEKIMLSQTNGLYLAFNNEVVEEMRLKGFVCKTIDSLFSSYIIPKFTSLIPIVGNGAKVAYIDIENLPPNLKGIGNICIYEDGSIKNKNKSTGFNLNVTNEQLYRTNKVPNLLLLKYIFGKDTLRLSHALRANLMCFILSNYPNEVIEILESRFSFIILDEAQDLKNHLEKFAQLIHNSKIRTYFLGDCNQNINGGGKWFDELESTRFLSNSFRCPESNCKWIRENLNIEIYGNNDKSEFNIIPLNDALSLDDGSRVLLYSAASGSIKDIVNKWSSEKHTIKEAKGKTIDKDIVIVGKSLNTKSYYTAITRTTRNVFSTINKIS